MNYEQAYKTLSKFVNENEFDGVEESRELFKVMDEELDSDNEIINGLPLGHKE